LIPFAKQGNALKSLSITTLATLALALAAWLFLYVQIPEAPLSAGGTSVVVGICAVIARVAAWLWEKLRQAWPCHKSRRAKRSRRITGSKKLKRQTLRPSS